jgi:L,D-transpeptidase YcbB
MGNTGKFRAGRVARGAVALALTVASASVLPAEALAKRTPAPVEATAATEIRALATNPDIADFYGARAYRPLWFDAGGRMLPAGRAFLELAQSVEIDGAEATLPNLGGLLEAVSRAEVDKSPAAIARAETMLSSHFAAYAAALVRSSPGEMLYEHDTMRGRLLPARGFLEMAASAPSLEAYVREMGWMHPLYAPLRWAAAATFDPAERQVLANNLARLRAIPSRPAERYILVDAASARLWMYEGGRAVDSMKVVVGKPVLQTPMIAGYVRHAVVNPYWNVPQDLIREKIAPNALRGGSGYLRSARYEVLSDWSDDAVAIDPASVDWKKVIAGDLEVRVRQLPSPTNAMGKVKYEFPNPLGIYLHDTPDKDLMLKADRQFSSGCIRLEDADRLGRWLLRAPLPQAGGNAEQKVPLPEPVPVYVTYLTAFPDNGRIALGPDPYGRDGMRTRLADRGSAEAALRR